MKLYLKTFLLLILISGNCLKAYAQIKTNSTINKDSDCEKKLTEAQNLYNSGQFFESEKMLKEINSSGCYLNKARRVDAYELLIKNQLELDKVSEADSTVYRMLKFNPHYELKGANNTDDYNRLINKFDVHPMFTIGARNSACHPSFKIKKTYSVLSDVDYGTHYQTAINYFFITEYYGWLEYGFNKNLSINLEGIFNGFNYYRDFTKPNNWEMYYTETMKFLEIPVYLKASTTPFSIGTIKASGLVFYGALGFGYIRVLNASANASLSYYKEDIYTGETSQYVFNDRDIDVLPMRNKNLFEGVGEVGLGYKFRNLKICLFARYFKGLTSLTNSEHRFDNKLLLEGYYYIDDEVVLNKYEIGATISFTFKNSIRKTK